MSGVFISYTRADLGPVRDIEQGLRAAHVAVWRDQDQLYGGQRWPKALGEAIAAQDFLLLCWSAKAATSTYVELEWCTALALKKPIIPWLLDDTPLPTSLRAVQSIAARHPVEAVPAFLTALEQAPLLSIRSRLNRSSTSLPASRPVHRRLHSKPSNKSCINPVGPFMAPCIRRPGTSSLAPRPIPQRNPSPRNRCSTAGRRGWPWFLRS